MKSMVESVEMASTSTKQYEPPDLAVIGDARDVVFGVPGSGFDGRNGYSEPLFEFAADDGDVW
jgi:hypothetical protein